MTRPIFCSGHLVSLFGSPRPIFYNGVYKRLRPLNLLSASSVNRHGLANTSIFHNNLRVMLSPLKSPVLRKYTIPFKRPGMYPSISKCNAKRCNCCVHLCTKSTVTSSVNGKKIFSR